MEKRRVSIPVSLAAIWILLLLVMNSLKVPHHFRIGIYLNLFFILAVIIIGLYVQVKKDKEFHPFVVNFKNSLKNAGKYILIVVVFLFCYLKFINPQFLKNHVKAAIEQALSVPFETIQENNAFFTDKTEEDYIEQATQSSEIMGDTTTVLSFYFLGMFLISVMYSIIVPLFYKKIVLRL
jgi:flagellar biosynthesis/type III secretory pathway M-ring protein FliF/YscJ